MANPGVNSSGIIGTDGKFRRICRNVSVSSQDSEIEIFDSGSIDDGGSDNYHSDVSLRQTKGVLFIHNPQILYIRSGINCIYGEYNRPKTRNSKMAVII